MKCWKCGFDQEDPPNGRLPFRATCDGCTAWLHCCRNCTNYRPGRPNDCAIPRTEYVADREASNLCEEFRLMGVGPSQKGDPKAAAERLFGGNEQSDDKNTGFDTLFYDDPFIE